MKSKTPLALIEQSLMLLVFALAAALCLGAFAWSDSASKNNAQRDTALLHAQSMAEALKSTKGDYRRAASLCGGSWDGEKWVSQLNGTELYAAAEHSPSPYLGTAGIYTQAGEKLLSVSWQEVAANE